MLILAASVLAFIAGIVVGTLWCARDLEWLLQSLADDGQIVVKTEGGWQGTPAALLSLAAWMKGTK